MDHRHYRPTQTSRRSCDRATGFHAKSGLTGPPRVTRGVRWLTEGSFSAHTTPTCSATSIEGTTATAAARLSARWSQRRQQTMNDRATHRNEPNGTVRTAQRTTNYRARHRTDRRSRKPSAPSHSFYWSVTEWALTEPCSGGAFRSLLTIGDGAFLGTGHVRASSLGEKKFGRRLASAAATSRWFDRADERPARPQYGAPDLAHMNFAARLSDERRAAEQRCRRDEEVDAHWRLRPWSDAA